MLFNRKNRKRTVDDLSGVGTLGTHMVASTFVGLALGWFLDDWLGTKPWLLLIFLFFGIAAGFKNILVEARKLNRQESVYDKAKRAQAESREEAEEEYATQQESEAKERETK